MQHNSASLIRPPSHFSSQRNSLTTISSEENKKRSIVILSLIATCVFLFVLVLCLLSALVLVGKNLSSSSSTTKSNVISLNNEKDLLNAYHLNNDNYFDNENNEHFVNITTIFLPNRVQNRSESEVKLSSTKLRSRTMNIAKMTSKIVEKLSFRLPSHVKPYLYELFIHPDLQNETFDGSVSIKINVSQPTSYIVLHSKKLAITDTILKRIQPNGIDKTINITQQYPYDLHEYWVIETEDIPSGDYSLSMKFNGSLAKRIVGMYSSSYFDKLTNETRKIATSKFEPTYAREAFPCFDEPAMKAKFKITLVRPESDSYSALSNMNQVSEKAGPGPGLKTVEFAESVPMSTYLTVFIVSDFGKEDAIIDSNGIGKNFPLRVFAAPAQMNKVWYARETAKKVMEYYIQYFQIEYPLPKIDMAAIPDFVSGAMETWGLITYRETSILYDAKTSSTANKQRVATVIAHELAHMWFGNLVTMKWWNDLWLNEGFASYIEYKGVNEAEPTWGIMEQFLIDDLHGVMGLDATLGSHPIVQKVESPIQITEIFDTITYAKGASIIRMLEDFVTPAIFQEGIKNYLNKHAYDNAETDDLLVELNALYKEEDVMLIMATWTKQMGLPVVVVNQNSATQYRLTQKRFLADPDNDDKDSESSEFNYKWSIPITYITSSSKNIQRTWFKHDDEHVIINIAPGTTWFKLNVGQIGYYRVNYPSALWAEFEKQLITDVNTFSIGDRASLLNDAFNLADATKMKYEDALTLTKYLTKETEYVPWSVAANKLKSISSMLYPFDSYFDSIEYSQTLFADIYKAVGWEIKEADTDHMKNRLRPTILDLACSMEDAECLKEAGKKFQDWLKDPVKNYVAPDLRNVVYYFGIQETATEKQWNEVLEIFRKETDAQEKSKLMNALAAINNERVLRRYIDLALDEKYVRKQDALTCLQNIAANRIGERLVWDYVYENWLHLVDIFGIDDRNLGRLIPGITKRFATKARKMNLEDFCTRYPEAGAGAAARIQALENVDNNIKWLVRHEKVIADWFTSVKQMMA